MGSNGSMGSSWCMGSNGSMGSSRSRFYIFFIGSSKSVYFQVYILDWKSINIFFKSSTKPVKGGGVLARSLSTIFARSSLKMFFCTKLVNDDRDFFGTMVVNGIVFCTMLVIGWVVLQC